MPPNSESSPLSVETFRTTGKTQSSNHKKSTSTKTNRAAVCDEGTFSILDLQKAIPKHCFQPTLVESFSHLGLDLLQVMLAIAAVLYLDNIFQSNLPVRAVVWLAYWIFQGITLTGVWVIAHECGHGGFSTNSLINDIVGFVLHSALYVPYFSWQRTHASHHAYTNHLEKDEVFVPSKHDSKTSLKPRDPVTIFFALLVMLVFGWPMYLIYNVAGHPADGFNSHFWPFSSIFKDKDRLKIVLSDIGLIAWTVALVALGNMFGSGLVLALYLPPLLIVNGFLVSITYLQHTDLKIPHYDSDEWNKIRGALCTIDRTMGSFLDFKLHYIHSTHVAHHLFARIPFYRAQEATEALIPVLGKYYNVDKSNFAVALFRNFRDCNFIEDKRGIVFWMEEHLG